MDFASIIGILAGFALIISAIFIGGEAHGFINMPGGMIVLGGTVAATLLTFPIKDVWAAFKSAFRVFTKEKQTPQDMIHTIIGLAKLARVNGLLALSDIETNSPFLKRAANLLADAADEAIFEHTLRTEINSLKMRHFAVQEVFKRMAIYAPAFGMLGTLIGLIQMLAKLNDPSSVGPSMAVALLTTFYGSFLATMVFLPISGKLKTRTMDEIMNLEIIYHGTHSIMHGINPMMLHEKLLSYLPERDRKVIIVDGKD